MSYTHFLIIPTSKAGDQAPDGYLQWHEWARVQHKAGLRQRQCGKCSLWRYPQELSGEEVRFEAKTRRGNSVMVSEPICNECHLSGALRDAKGRKE